MSGLELVGVFSASVVGSLHCVGMCGPFVATYAGDARGRGELGAHAFYQSGRGVAYVALGAIAGALGSALNLAGEWLGVVRIAALVSSALVILWGLTTLYRGSSGRGLFRKTLANSLVQLRRRSIAQRSALLGVLTPLLPCGWLYAFLLSAAGTGTAQGGAALMGVFWLGNVPALLGLGALFARAGGALRERIPVLSAVLLIGLGVSGLVLRAPLFRHLTATPDGVTECH